LKRAQKRTANVTEITVGWIAEVTGGRLYRPRPAQGKLTGFAIDSRRVSPGQFFIALEGERTDGHLYLKEAFARGASGALVERAKLELACDLFNIVAVEDTKAALWQLARAWREGFRARVPIIGITGSSGKTTTKELLWQMLATRFRAYRSPGNYNTEYGLPLAILGMPPDAEVGVFELALQRPGEIGRLAELLRPQVGVITTVGDAHLGFFRSREELAAAKWELVERLSPGDSMMAIVNLDVSHLRERAEGLAKGKPRVIGFGLSSLAPYRATEIDDTWLEGLRFTLSTPRGELPVKTKLLGRLNVVNALAAATAAMELGVELRQVGEALEGFRPFPHRLALVHSPLGLIIDDSYNASPAAVRAALEALGRLKAGTSRRKVLVLGDMLELGRWAEMAHRELARAIAAAGVELFFALGELTRLTARELLELGWAPERVVTASCLAELVRALRERLPDERNLILVKGSRAMELDKLVVALTGGACGSDLGLAENEES